MGVVSNVLTFVNPISHGVKEDPPSHGGGYYNHGLKQIFSYRFLAVSLHISIVLYIRTSHAMELSLASKLCIWGPFKDREKLKKIEGPLTLEGCQTKSGVARAFNFLKKNDGRGHTLKVKKYRQLISMFKLCYMR